MRIENAAVNLGPNPEGARGVADRMRAALAYLDEHRSCACGREASIARHDGQGFRGICERCSTRERESTQQQAANRRELARLVDEELTTGSSTLIGIAVPFTAQHVYLGRRAGHERIVRGAFQRSMQTRAVMACLDHDQNRMIGTTTDGSLRLSEPSAGLYFEIDGRSRDARSHDIVRRVRRGDYPGVSVSFTARRAEPYGPSARTVLEADLVEISLVRRPAYISSWVSVDDDLARKRLARDNAYARSQGQ